MDLYAYDTTYICEENENRLLVEQCLHALFECQEDVDEITKNHTEAVSGDFYVISLFLRKLILGVT